MTSTRRLLTPHHGIVPPYLLARLAVVDQPEVAAHWEVQPDLPDRQATRVAEAARRTIATDNRLRRHREVYTERGRGDHGGLLPGTIAPQHTLPKPSKPARSAAAATVQRSIHDADNDTTLPGKLVRAEGAAATKDVAVNEAYDGLGATWDLY